MLAFSEGRQQIFVRHIRDAGGGYAGSAPRLAAVGACADIIVLLVSLGIAWMACE